MIPTVVKMVEAEDPARIEHFVKKTLGLCVYILEGEGGELLVQSQEMPREDANDTDGSGAEASAPASASGEDPSGEEGLLRDTLGDVQALVLADGETIDEG